MSSDSDRENGVPVDIDGIVTADAAVPAGAEGEGGAEAGLGVKLDLAAWARGNRNYLTAEVIHVIDRYMLAEIEDIAARVNRLKTRRDALRFVIDLGLVSADEARKDF